MHNIRLDQNAESSDFQTNSTARDVKYHDCLEPSGPETEGPLIDKLSFYQRVLESDRNSLSGKTWPSIDFFEFQMRLADRISSADEHHILGADALVMAKQPRITDPTELQRVLVSALSGPTRSIWIEAEIGLRFEALRRVNEQFGLLPNNYGPNPSRIGLLVDKASDEKILLRTVWYDEDTEDASTVNNDSSTKDKAYHEFMSVHSFPAAIRINVSESVEFPTLIEFKERLKNGDPSVLKYFATDRPRSISLAIELLRPDRDFAEFAWWSYCLDQMVQPELCHDKYDELHINELMSVGYSRSQTEEKATVSLTSEVANLAGLTTILSAAGYGLELDSINI